VSGPKKHLVRDRSRDGNAVGAYCGYSGVRDDASQEFRRLGGFRFLVAERREDVTCGTCLARADCN
jgi:hypothetical protein